MFSKEPEHYNFPYPLFVTSIHMFVQWSLSALTIYALPNLRPTGRPAPRDYAYVATSGCNRPQLGAPRSSAADGRLIMLQIKGCAVRDGDCT